VTSLPGPYSFGVAPYVREIVDCLDVNSPVRELTLMKGAQVLGTVGVIENGLGYFIDQVKTAPVMLLTADADLAKLRLESYITPMLRFSGLEHLIKSVDEDNNRKTGKTDRKIEWEGGGFLIPFGAKSANKLRSFSIQVLFRDEIDAYPDTVGKDGDPIKLSADRTAAYEASRKIVDVSTPLIKGSSKIYSRFQRGDQRYYFVRCLKCNFAQTLRWRRTNHETGEVTGITWETESGRLIPDSVRYLCRECGHPHVNDDKVRLLSPAHGAEWRPTAVPADPHHRSYHLSALYSPVGMRTWGSCALRWLDAWDVEHNRSKDNAVLQVFYNNDLGEPFEVYGEKVVFTAVSSHRRAYHLGEVPNKFASSYCGGPVLVLTCAVDVHGDNLAVAVIGWCRDRRAVLVDYWRFEGNTERLDDPGTWGRLRELIETKTYEADDGKAYRLGLTLIDSGYRTDDVYRFCAEYEVGVFPVKGRDAQNAANLREFSEFKTPNGQVGYGITVDFYKDRWSGALRRSWDGLSLQPQGHFNAPVNTTDKQLKELTVEQKRQRKIQSTGKLIGWEWHRPSGADNELWDCLVYASAGLDIIANDVCVKQLEQDAINWHEFFSVLETQRPFFTEPTKDGGR
jgi:phage terminase large subunit GpA-like protein